MAHSEASDEEEIIWIHERPEKLIQQWGQAGINITSTNQQPDNITCVSLSNTDHLVARKSNLINATTNGTPSYHTEYGSSLFALRVAARRDETHLVTDKGETHDSVAKKQFSSEEYNKNLVSMIVEHGYDDDMAQVREMWVKQTK